MANNLLPMRMGELVRTHFVGEREGVSKTAALMTIFVERTFDALTLLLFIAATALFVPLGGLAQGFEERAGLPWPLLAAGMTVPFIGAFGALLLLAHLPDRARSAAGAAIRLAPQRLGTRLLGLVEMLLHGLAPLRSTRDRRAAAGALGADMAVRGGAVLPDRAVVRDGGAVRQRG